MRETACLLTCLSGLIACGGEEPRLRGSGETAHAEHDEGMREVGADEEEEGPRPTRVLEGGGRLFGAELANRQEVALSALVQSPAQYDGQLVRTEGTIERVCQRMGCWMELRGPDAPAVRVPMAGHAFFLPRDVAGRQAMIEGRVEVRELSEEARRHLQSEGALALSSSLSIEADSVVVR